MLTYSRDICISALKEVEQMFLDIQTGKFDPDATRSLIVTSISAKLTGDQGGDQDQEGDGGQHDNESGVELEKKMVNKEIPDDLKKGKSGDRLRDLEKEEEGSEAASEASVDMDDFCSDGEEDDVLLIDEKLEQVECAMGDYLINPKSGCAHVALDSRLPYGLRCSGVRFRRARGL